MAIPLRVCLYDPVGSTEGAFDVPFQQVGGLQIVAVCADWQEMQELLHARRIDAAIVNLDGGRGDDGSYVVRRIAEVAPDCGIIGVSQNAQPDTIISAMRAGCSQFVRWPIDQDDLRAAIDRVRQKCTATTGDCRRICVIGSAGGAGTTTVACNLAMELAHVTGSRCGLVDMDLQYGDVACAFDATPKYSIADVCRPGTEIDRTLLEDAAEDLACNVSILVGPQAVDVSLELSQDGLDQMFRTLSQMFPFVVVDLPRYFSPTSIVALSGTDRVILLTQLTVPHLRNATRIYEGLLQLGIDEERIEITLNRCNASFERIKPEEVEKHFGRPVFGAIPNDYKRIGSSRDLGHPIMSDSPNSPARLAIQDIARRLASGYLGEDPVRVAGSGMFGMFRRRRAKPVY